MLNRSTFFASMFLVAAGIGGMIMAPGCSSSSGGDTPADTGTSSGESLKPPARPTTKATGTTKWFAVKKLYLGTSDRTGKVSSKAWEQFGFDIDGQNTTADKAKTNTDVCKRVEGAPAGINTDGAKGVDNNFGSQVMSVIKSLKSDAEDQVNGTLTDGSFTLLLKIDNYTETDNDSAPGQLYVATYYGGKDSGKKPSFSASDTEWQILDASLDASGKPKLQFPKAYVSNGQWVSGDFGTGTIELAIALSGAEIKLPIDSGVITFNVKDGTGGNIAGAMNTKKLQDSLTPIAKKFGICPGNATYDQVVNTLTQGADLVSGAPNLQDKSQTCNAISIALGFDLAPTGDHTSAKVYKSETTTGPDECDKPDGGTDAASGG